MDKKTIFVKTSKGDDETTSKTSHLYGDIKRIMSLIDNKSTVAELTKRAAPSLRESLDEMLQKLLDSGFIQDSAKLPLITPKVAPSKSGGELDFTGSDRANKDRAMEAAAKERAELEASQVRAKKEELRINAEIAAVAEAKAKREEEARQREEARIRAEAEVARIKAEQDAARIREQIEVAEAKALAEAEAARFKAAQDAIKIRIEREMAEAKARAEAEAARLKAEQEAARLRMEHEAAHANARAEAARLLAEREAIQAQARAEEDAARLKAEYEASKIRAEQEITRAKERAAAQAEAHAKAEATRLAEREVAQAQAREIAEAARSKAQQQEATVIAAREAAQALEVGEARADEQTRAGEQKRAEEQARIDEQDRDEQDRDEQVRADEQVNKLAQAQAKVWSDAEQRAKVQTASPQQIEKSPAQPDTSVPQPEAVRRVRKVSKPFPWGGAGASLVAITLLAIFLLPYVWPMQGYVSKIEQKLSEQLKQPVHIDKLHVTLLPRQKMELQNVSVGDSKSLRADKVTLIFSVITLFAETKKISSAEVDNLTLSTHSFNETLPWLQAAGSVTNYPISRLVLQNAQLSDSGLNLPKINGVIEFDEQGKLIKTILNSEDGKIAMDLRPLLPSWKITLQLRGSALPLMPQIVYDELSLDGFVDAGAANFSEIEGYVFGGRIVGNARLTWGDNWQLQGSMSVKNLELTNALAQLAVAGKLDSEGKFMLRGTTLPQLAQAPRVEGSFAVKNGVISKIDIVEMALTPSRASTSGGRTHFDELSGTFLSDPSGLHLRQMKISAGVMAAKGSLDLASGKDWAAQQLSGKLAVDLKMRAEMGSIPLVISGTPVTPLLRSGR